jgi:hypothetical protein
LNLEKISKTFSLRKIISVCGRGFGRGNLQENPGDLFLEEITLVYSYLNVERKVSFVILVSVQDGLDHRPIK